MREILPIRFNSFSISALLRESISFICEAILSFVKSGLISENFYDEMHLKEDILKFDIQTVHKLILLIFLKVGSMFSTLAISVERYLAVVHPFAKFR